MTDQPIARHIPVQYDGRGNPTWRTVMSPPDNSYGKCYMVPDRVIPVIFVPGVMGSNLIQKGKKPEDAIKWRLDSKASVGIWATRGPRTRKRFLNPEAMEVDKNGVVPEDTPLPAEELRRRGWGEIAAMSYQDILVWLENALNDFDDCKLGQRVQLMEMDLGATTGESRPTREEVGLSYRYRFPVYACGYNWLASNADSAERLSRRIDEVIRRYRKEGKKCEKVIIVTHSMGGLLARHCSEVLNRRDDIMGIVHGVMPAIGAAAVYRRFKSGTEGPHIAAKVLGEDAAEMTAVLSSAPGPMQLLPTPEYGNGWLRVKEGAQEHRFPQYGDPYGEIYTVRDQWWGLCDEALINPLNKEADPGRRRAQVDKDWGSYSTTIEKKIRAFHKTLTGRYHPNTHAFFGNSETHKAYGTVTWSGAGLFGEMREADILSARPDVRLYGGSQLDTTRVLAAPLRSDAGRKAALRFVISEPDEPGDGTVPYRSGISPKAHCRAFLEVKVEHEPAFKPHESDDNLRACRFTLRAIVKIAQSVQETSLRYD